jgi:hypothetical protein
LRVIDKRGHGSIAGSAVRPCLPIEIHQRRVVRPHAQAPADVWSDVLEQDFSAMTRLSLGMRRLLYEAGGRVPHWLAHAATAGVYPWLRRNRGRFLAETDHLADRVGVLSRAQMAFAQRQYTLAHAGCTTAVTWDGTLRELVCFRSLDWPASEWLGQASRIFEWLTEGGKTLGLAAGIAGMVGALTVARPGWCAVINASPMRRSIWPGEDPTFLLRDALTDPALVTYEHAKRRCLSWRPSAPFFLTLAGPAQACVVEFGRRATHVRAMTGLEPLVQTNHHAQDGPFARANPPAGWESSTSCAYQMPLMESSQQRFRTVQSEAVNAGSHSGSGALEAFHQTWAQPPVWNHQTAQWVWMRPATGELRLWVFDDAPTGA